MKFSPLHVEFGAEVTGVTVSDNLSAAEFAQLDEAMNTYSVLLFRNQSMEDRVLMSFSRLFGALEEEHVSYYSHGKINYIGRVGNIDADGNRMKNRARTVRSQTGNQLWHSDSSFRENPSLYSLLLAHEVPPDAGDTEFVSARAAYHRLANKMADDMDGLIGIHDYIYSRTKVSEDAVNQSQRTYMRPVRQRLVRRNPVTGEKNFYIGSHVRAIEGVTAEESNRLITHLMAETTRAESIYRHHWQAGDLLIWDNRCILHRGCGYDADRHRRRLHQTRVRGSGPTLAEPV